MSRKEFHKAMPALGLDVPKADVDELFNLWDNDGGGSLAYKELKTLLSKTPKKKEKLILSGDPNTPLSEQVCDGGHTPRGPHLPIPSPY